MATKVQIISNALTMMGKDPIITLDNGDVLTVAAEQAFDLIYPSVISQNNWRFAVQIQQLSESVETPPEPWKTIYLLPAGWVRTIRLYPQNYVWEIYENNKIYSMYEGELKMEYVFIPDIEKAPPVFAHYFTAELAAYLALSNAEKPEYLGVLKTQRDFLYSVACAQVAQNRPQNFQASFPMLSSRNITGQMGNGW